MRDQFPANHGLSDADVERLVFKDELAHPSLTDVQFLALEHGIGRGESLLVVSPTSTGKTQIGIWAIAKSLAAGQNTVYLVTLRALAKQKFEDFRSILLNTYLGGVSESLVIATGDYVEDADGQVPSDPLHAPLLIATYEKYLAMLSAGGVPRDMRRTVIVCDEMQLIGDEHRGGSVEILLTLLRNARWSQFVGLSAVLPDSDANSLANWLGITAVISRNREKHLRYECWTHDRIASITTERDDVIEEDTPPHANVGLDAVSALMHLLARPTPPTPVIVFCMRKQDTYDLARMFVERAYPNARRQASLEFEALPETVANEFLADVLGHRVASHNADLTDEEREIIERYLLEGRVDVIFATTTLAAGVNFPLGAAIFAKWARWDADVGSHLPIESSEFHNMAGRVGRMGFAHDQGTVVFFAANAQEVAHARRYMALTELSPVQPRITPERFNQLALNLVTSGLCRTRHEVAGLILTTFSALCEEDRNAVSFVLWPTRIEAAIDSLVASSLVIAGRDGRLAATPVGKAIGYSGLLPETGVYLAEFLATRAQHLASLLPSAGAAGDMNQLAFLLFAACLSSPEFRPPRDVEPTRFLPWPLRELVLWDPGALAAFLPDPDWQFDTAPINAAWLCGEWIEGSRLRDLEGAARNLSAGMITELNRNLVWMLQGLAAIAKAAADRTVPLGSRPQGLRVGDEVLRAIKKMIRPIKRFSFRLQEGLPDDVLWMTELSQATGQFRLARHEILELRAQGLVSPESVMLGSAAADTARRAAFARSRPDANTKSNWLRDAARDWKSNQRAFGATRHARRVARCARRDLLDRFYGTTGVQFEAAFEEVLTFLNIPYEKLDNRDRQGAPDYLVQWAELPAVIIELKSREGGKLIDHNRAVEVLAASEVHGHRESFCVTLCQPGVDPSVPPVIAECGRLSVVEVTDLAEALVRYCEGVLTAQQFHGWLTTPGQALSSDLPFREYG